jgi:hypothetical protein
MTEYSVIIPTHNILKRGWERLKWQLISLELQTRLPKTVFLPDSSDEKNAQIVRSLAGGKWPFEVVYFHLDNPEGFNMPKLFNRALEQVETEYTLCTGVDFVYAPKTMEQYVRFESPKCFLLKEVEMLPNKVITEKNVRSWTFPRTKPNQFGKGADGIQYAPTAFFTDIAGGYDERMAGFGGMDNDMHNRARKAGMNCMWMPKKPGRILHIHHPSFKTTGDPQSKANWRIRDDKEQPINRGFIR